jgi:hypothetical protein
MSQVVEGDLPAGEPSPAAKWDREVAQRALDELFNLAHQYRSSAAYDDLLKFVARFRFYSPFNAMLIHVQMPGARYVAPPHRWQRDYERRIKVAARPIVILQPMGPVMFVFDVIDTEPMVGGRPRPLPPQVDRPFEVLKGRIGKELGQTAENAKRDGIEVIEREAGSQHAGSIRWDGSGGVLEFVTRARPERESIAVPRRFVIELNIKLSAEARYATLVHELGHLYCGHLGTPNQRWWPDRRGLGHELRELEAESVCYLVCERLGIENASAEYLASYLRHKTETPPISLDCVMKTAGLIEQMAHERLRPRERER